MKKTITRRDFLNGVAVSTVAVSTAALSMAAVATAPYRSQPLHAAINAAVRAVGEVVA